MMRPSDRISRLATLILAIAAILAPQAESAEDAQSPASFPLFDGETFEGWEGDLAWFHLEDGAIVSGSLDEKIPHNQFLCTTTKFSDFELRFKVKVEGNANGGVQFRSKRVEGSTEVSGFQADLGWNFWGCLYDESRRNKTLSCADEDVQKQLVRKDDWNDYVIRAEGNRIQLFLNGVKTVDYTEQDEAIAREGIIGLQIHSGPPTRIWYKDLSIKSLPSGEE